LPAAAATAAKAANAVAASAVAARATASADTAATAAARAIASAATPQSPAVSGGPRCSGTAAAPGSLHLQLGKSTLMRLPETVLSRSIGNPAVAQAMLVAPDTLYVVGVDIGSTNMIVQGRSGLCSVIEVAVGMDTAGVQAALAELLPDEHGIRVTSAADALVLSGTVADAVALASALEIAAAFVHRPALALAAHRDAAAPAAATAAGAAAPSAAGSGGGRIINLLGVSAPQQVMLEVKIAEVSKTLIDQLEAGTALRYAGGSWTAALLSNFLTGTLASGLNLSKSNGSQLNLQAGKQDGLVRMLAEPTVMAISGQEGSFLAGGSIYVPVAQDNNKVTLEEKEFGVGLRFTPTVLAGGRINLKVAPEVSDVSREGIGISAAGGNGVAVLPLITKRRAATTVQLYDGQSFAIGGLIKNNQTANINGLPLLGELPVLGALFRSSDFQHDRTELLFVITVHLVKPLPPDYALPTDSLTPPSRTGLFLGGRLEGAPAAAPASARPAPDFEVK
ncbi:type II and III secretion system protein family protein, partial [Rugamonas sp.]|uniref:type II and III secretion system protein family protein n=1 Tax=Rugamonas sp. TaxID=1926287 RepID=UPI00345C3115